MFQYLSKIVSKNKNIMIICKRKLNYDRKEFPYHYFEKLPEYEQVLVDGFGFRRSRIRKILWHQDYLFRVPIDRIAKHCQLCREWKIYPLNLSENASLLAWPTFELEHRVLLLQEIGFGSMSTYMVSNYEKVIKMRMSLLKAFIRMPKNVNVAENLLACLEKPPPSVSSLERLDDDLSVEEYQKKCLEWYAHWRLDIPKDDTEQMTRVVNSMTNRSFRLTRKLINTLQYEIGIPLQMLKDYNMLKNGSAEDLNKIMTEIGTFAGISFKQLIKKCPLLHKMRYDNVVELIKLFEEHDFTNRSLRAWPLVLILRRDVVAKRLEIIRETMELRVLKNSSSTLRLVCMFNNVQPRLDYLRYLNMKHVTIRVLTSGIDDFERYIRTGLDFSKGREIGFSFEKLLNLDRKTITGKIVRHPFWRHVDIVSMHDTFNYLVQHFKPEDFHDCLPLLLYPKEKIAEVLQSLPEYKEKENHSPKKILALVIYLIEAEYNFSGDGIWKCEPTSEPQQTRFDESRPESDWSDFSDSENTDSEEHTEEQPEELSNNDVYKQM